LERPYLAVESLHLGRLGLGGWVEWFPLAIARPLMAEVGFLKGRRVPSRSFPFCVSLLHPALYSPPRFSPPSTDFPPPRTKEFPPGSHRCSAPAFHDVAIKLCATPSYPRQSQDRPPCRRRSVLPFKRPQGFPSFKESKKSFSHATFHRKFFHEPADPLRQS